MKVHLELTGSESRKSECRNDTKNVIEYFGELYKTSQNDLLYMHLDQLHFSDYSYNNDKLQFI